MNLTPYVLAAALLAPVLPAVAQEAPPPAPKQVTVRPGLVVTDQDVFAFYVDATADNDNGQFALVELHVAEADTGFVQVTRCDNIVIICQPFVIRAEGVNQGDGGALVWGE